MFRKNVLHAARQGGSHIQLVTAKSKYRDKFIRLIRTGGLAIPVLTSDFQQRAQGYWERYYGTKINLSWHAAYAAVTGYESERYIPEDLYYMDIEPALNRKEDLRQHSFEELTAPFVSRDFIVQESIKQHEDLNRIYPCSINTLRLLTLRFKGGIYLLSAHVRFRNDGSKLTDETRVLACSVGLDGRLNESAIDRCGIRYGRHPYTNYAFGQARIPNYGSLTRHVESLHDQLHHFDLISWDIAVSSDGLPVLMDIQVKGQEINGYQFTDGPLFGHWTEEILQLVKNRKADGW